MGHQHHMQDHVGGGGGILSEEHGVMILSNGTLLFARAERGHEGRYLCEANNAVGGGLSEAVHLHVHGEPLSNI